MGLGASQRGFQASQKDGISLHSTGLRSLPGLLPKKKGSEFVLFFLIIQGWFHLLDSADLFMYRLSSSIPGLSEDVIETKMTATTTTTTTTAENGVSCAFELMDILWCNQS